MPTELDHPAHAFAGVMRDFHQMATHAAGKPFDAWPGWSTGETLAVALILERHDVLQRMHFGMLEAVDRVDILTPSQMLAIRRAL